MMEVDKKEDKDRRGMGTALCPLRNGLPAAGRCGTCSGNAPQALPQVGGALRQP